MKFLKNQRIKKNFYEIIDCEDKIENNDTPLSAAKKKILVCGKLLMMLKKKILMHNFSRQYRCTFCDFKIKYENDRKYK